MAKSPEGIYHTTDGNTVYIDSVTKEATIFEGIITLDKILEPVAMTPGQNDELKGLMELVNKLIGVGPMVSMTDIVILPMKKLETGPAPGPKTDDDLVLGPTEYFIIIPKENDYLIKTGSCPFSAWVSEFQHGHKPDYKGHSKHRILPEQYKWLDGHKDCTLSTWSSPECPVFVSLACVTHGKVIEPSLVPDKSSNASEPSLLTNTYSVKSQEESISTEEREI